MVETIDYPSHALPDTHPARLAAAAFLQGLDPAPLRSCRVLELGCASGGNLLPLAHSIPDGRLLGVDSAAAAIAQGQALCDRLALSQVELRTSDILDLPEDPEQMGPFDYIVCNGVFSWVSDAVRQKILRLCGRLLRPQGVAYISYNAYPGYFRRQPIREMMRYHTEGMEDAAMSVKQARALLRLLQLSDPDPDSTSARLLRDEDERLRSTPDGYLFHEHLVPEVRAFYFSEFMALAEAEGLAYVTEAEGQSELGEFPEPVARALRPLAADRVRLEQYLDFLRNRGYRRTLLCHSAALPATPLAAAERLRRVQTLYVGCYAAPETPSPQIFSDAPERFRSRNAVVTVTLPAMKAVLLALFQARPRPLSLPELTHEVAELLHRAQPADTIAELVLVADRLSLLTLWPERLPVALSAGEKPRAPALARAQAQSQDRDGSITNLLHETAELGEEDRALLTLCDGSRDRAALLEELPVLLRRGQLPSQPADLQRWLAEALERLRRLGLLLA